MRYAASPNYFLGEFVVLSVNLKWKPQQSSCLHVESPSMSLGRGEGSGGTEWGRGSLGCSLKCSIAEIEMQGELS